MPRDHLKACVVWQYCKQYRKLFFQLDIPEVSNNYNLCYKWLNYDYLSCVEAISLRKKGEKIAFFLRPYVDVIKT